MNFGFYARNIILPEMVSTIVSALILFRVIAVINNGMNLMHVNSYWQKVVIGSIILFAVILDMAQKKRKV